VHQSSLFFFFQAEDGIRDRTVTGVQTCALPIYRNQSPDVGMTIFGLITVVAGLVSTLLGGVIADKLRPRFAGSYFWVSGIGMLIACPLFIATLYIPFPAAWVAMFLVIFFLFLNTGPSNTALANVSLPTVRATAFAVNLFVIH